MTAAPTTDPSASLMIPRRVSLVAQTAEAIRAALAAGTWSGALPGERRLCALLQVSRPTLRAAVALLADEGALCDTRERQARGIASLGRPRPGTARRIVFITHEPLSHSPPVGNRRLDEIRADLAALGFVTETLLCQERSLRGQQHRIGRFFGSNRVLSYVLLSVNQRLQRWIATQGVPALVLGSCHPSVSLPSFDIDNRAVGRNAAGQLLGRGHRRIAYLVPDSDGIGDLESEEGFLEAVRLHDPDDPVRARIVRHDGTARNVTLLLDAVLGAANPPTGLLVAKSRVALIVLVHLLRHGIDVPGRISLICRDQDDLFAELRPQLAHFCYDGGALTRRLGRQLTQLAANGAIPGRPYLIFPRFVPGTSLRSLD